MPGYCVAGTIGHKVLNGLKEIELKNGQKAPIKMAIEYMSFSAHADAKGIMQLIRTAQPENVMLVHGEHKKMNFLSDEINKELGLKCYKPANGETVIINAALNSSVDCRSSLLSEIEKTYGPMSLTRSAGENITYRRRVLDDTRNSSNRDIQSLDRERVLNLALVISNNQEMCIMSDKQAFEEFNISGHAISLNHTTPYSSYMLKIGLYKALQKAYKRFSIVDGINLNEKVRENILRKKKKFIEIFQSFVLEIDAENKLFKFKWLYSEDDFADEFLIAYDEVLEARP